MAFRQVSLYNFGNFVSILAAASPGDCRTYTFSEDVAPERISPKLVFCDPFYYLGQLVEAGTLNLDLPVRTNGSHDMKPVLEDRDSYYINSFRLPWTGKYIDSESVNTKLVKLVAGDVYIPEHNAGVMLAVGSLIVKRELTEREASAPSIIDVRISNLSLIAVTDAVICEVWV